MDKLQHTKPELSEFIWIFFGIDRSDYTKDQILELNDRLESLPDRLKIAKAKRLNLRDDKNFIEHLKMAVTKRLKETEKPNVISNGSEELKP